MNGRGYLLQFLPALAAGILGGLVAAGIFQLKSRQGPEEADPRKVVVASEYHLVDRKGKDRWVLGLSRAGEPCITFINRNGWAPMAVGINKDGLPFLNMILEPLQEKGPSLVMMDARMKTRILLGLSGDGDPRLVFLDSQGQTRALLGSMEIRDALTGSTEDRPIPSLVLQDEKGGVIWAAPDAPVARQVHARADAGAG